MKKPKDMVITLHDILLMDKGTAAYTEFNWDEDVVMYQMEHPELMDMTIGHIHSHNTMSVFFSSTDHSELNDNCPLHNFYLSVIVNNFMDIEAKIAFTAQSQNFVCKDETGKDYTLAIKGEEIKPMMFIYDCEIEKPYQEITVPDFFTERYKQIEERHKIAEEKAKKAKEEEDKKKSKDAKNTNTYHPKNQVVQGDFFRGGSLIQKSSFPDYDPKNKNHSGIGGMNQALAEQFEQETDDETFMEADYTKQTIEQEFATYVLRLGNALEDDELVDALEDIEQSQLNTNAIARSILESYGAYYATFFDRLTKYQGDQAFLEVLEELVEIYTEFQKDYPFLEPIIICLKELGIKFENFTKEEVTA